MVPRGVPAELDGPFASVVAATLRLDASERPTAAETLHMLVASSPMSVD